MSEENHASKVETKVTTEPIDTEPKTTESITTESITTESITTEPITTETLAAELKTLETIKSMHIKTELISPETISPETTRTESSVSEPLTTDNNGTDLLSADWLHLREGLTTTEREAVRIILKGEDIKAFALHHKVMLEVMIDKINEKAMEYIGDAIIESDEDVLIYEEYQLLVTGMVKD